MLKIVVRVSPSSLDNFTAEKISRPELYRAGDDVSCWIRQISRNSLTPAHILRRLAKSDNVELRVAVANHTNTPQEVLSLLAQDDHTDVKFAIADNQNSDPHVLGTLCEHSDPLISDRAERTLVRICEAGQVESSSKSTSV